MSNLDNITDADVEALQAEIKRLGAALRAALTATTPMDHRTPLTPEDAALVLIGDVRYVVPQPIADEIKRLRTTHASDEELRSLVAQAVPLFRALRDALYSGVHTLPEEERRGFRDLANDVAKWVNQTDPTRVVFPTTDIQRARAGCEVGESDDD